LLNPALSNLRRIKAAMTERAMISSKEDVMTYKTLLALADGDKGDRQTLEFAAELACVFGAQVQVAPAAADIAFELVDFGVAMGAPYTPQVTQALADDKASRTQQIEQACRDVCGTGRIAYAAQGGLPRLSVVDTALTPWLNISRRVSLADLVVVSQAYLSGELHVRGVLDDLLLRMRAPVFIARGSADSLVGTIAIAWDGSHEAGRAVRAALPLLKRAGRVAILQNKAGVSDFDYDPAPEALADYLALHGVIHAHLHVIAAGAEAQSLLTMAREEDADLLVAGAYSHPKIVERLLGGVTQSLVEAVDGPSLLLAH
jgi:nucleotide-binding universal stress UspA family protein